MEVECLGACANAPVVQINNDYYTDLDAAKMEALLAALGARRAAEAGLGDRAAGLRARRRADDPSRSGAGGQEIGKPPCCRTAIASSAISTGSRIGAWKARVRAGSGTIPRPCWRAAAMRSSTRSRSRICGGAAAPASRPASNGPSCPRSRTGGPPFSWSMPTSPSPAPARIARSCASTRICCSRAAWWPASPWAAAPPISTSAASSTPRPSISRPPSTRPMRPGSSARTPAARATTTTSSCIAAPAPISAARRRRCWRAWRARRASRG